MLFDLTYLTSSRFQERPPNCLLTATYAKNHCMKRQVALHFMCPILTQVPHYSRESVVVACVWSKHSAVKKRKISTLQSRKTDVLDVVFTANDILY